MTWVSVACAVLAVLCAVPPAGVRATHGSRAPGRRSGSGMRPVGAVGAGLAAWLLVGGAAGPVAAVVTAVGAHLLLARAETPAVRRERDEVARTLPHLVALLGSTLRAGAEPVAGLAHGCAALPGPVELAARSRLRQTGWTWSTTRPSTPWSPTSPATR